MHLFSNFVYEPFQVLTATKNTLTSVSGPVTVFIAHRKYVRKVPTNVFGELKPSTSEGKCFWWLRSGLVLGRNKVIGVENNF